MELNADSVVVRGGSSELPTPGSVFSGAVGDTLEEAAAAVSHGMIRSTTVKAIESNGGRVVVQPEITRAGVMNNRHVSIIEGRRPTTFSQPIRDPVPKQRRIR